MVLHNISCKRFVRPDFLYNNFLISAFFAVTLFYAFLTSALAEDVLTFSVSGFSIEGDNPLGDEAIKVLEPFIGKHSGLEGLYEARKTLEDKLIQQGYTFYRVTLPAQTLENGIIKLKFSAFKVTEAIVEGNKFFSDENIRTSLPSLLPGSVPELNALSSSLVLANSNPAKETTLSFKAGEKPETLTAVLNVRDVNPQSYFVLLSNAGTQETALSRLSLGYQNNNLFDKDHSMTVTYTTSPEEPSDINQFGLNYQLPVYGHGASLGLFLSASSVESGSVANNIEVKGSGNVIALSYSRPLPRSENYRHSIDFSLNHKLYDNEITQAGSPIGTDVTSSPVKLAYDAAFTYPVDGFGFHIDYESNVSVGSNNEDSDYAAVRTGATSDWSALHYAMNYSRRFSNSSLFITKFKGQQTSDVLISGEQFGVGGSNSVRAYEERSVLGDTGNEISLEFISQPLTDYHIKLLAFTDYAKVELNDVQAGGEDSTDISSVGFGLRWNNERMMSLKLDAGYALEDALLGTTSEIEKGDIKAHVSFLYRF
ncbi:MAG: hypothetical protein DIZ80_07610 [endosymbiont of Galathealinum brachiosum]|uniref:POTRA domain-containing protein n=1 Tax=endosymbiont of Galathealinum brachiosum TaxID=2200906 RepID=A0A370DGG7_9GAMM|nr:MAG: hypothetical protein DIZ80_07610 [endosymbiont of Galathealinum brachiosum]